MDVESAERVEAELDSFIEKRAREAWDARAIEEAWKESERARRRRRREENRALWIEFHARLAASHARISADHEARVEALLGEGEAAA